MYLYLRIPMRNPEVAKNCIKEKKNLTAGWVSMSRTLLLRYSFPTDRLHKSAAAMAAMTMTKLISVYRLKLCCSSYQYNPIVARLRHRNTNACILSSMLNLAKVVQDDAFGEVSRKPKFLEVNKSILYVLTYIRARCEFRL